MMVNGEKCFFRKKIELREKLQNVKPAVDGMDGPKGGISESKV